MKTLALLSGKGGVGKTTLAVHLAVAAASEGVRVGVLDTDPQGSSYRWIQNRDSGVENILETNPDRFSDRLKEMKDRGVELCVVDTPGHCGEGPTRVASLADLMLIPSRPGQLDLETVSQTLEVLMRASDELPRYYVVLSLARVGREGTVARDMQAVEQLEALGYKCARTYGAPSIHDRVAYEDAAKLAMTAAEYEPDGKAALEVHLLWRWVAREMKLSLAQKAA